jgi:hypothetical protein
LRQARHVIDLANARPRFNTDGGRCRAATAA